MYLHDGASSIAFVIYHMSALYMQNHELQYVNKRQLKAIVRQNKFIFLGKLGNNPFSICVV